MTDATTEPGGAATDRPLNLAEYFLLLDLDERRGNRLLDAQTSGLALAGAVLADLASRGYLQVTRNEVRVLEHEQLAGTPDLERPLAQVLQIITDHDKDHDSRDAEQWINRFSRSELRDALLQVLEERGVIEHTEGRVLWIFHRERYPVADPAPEQDLRARLGQALYGSAPTDGTTWPLLSLLRSTRLLHRIFPDREPDNVKDLVTTPAGDPATRDSVAEALEATRNAIAEYLVATTGGASALD